MKTSFRSSIEITQQQTPGERRKDPFQDQRRKRSSRRRSHRCCRPRFFICPSNDNIKLKSFSKSTSSKTFESISRAGSSTSKVPPSGVQPSTLHLLDSLGVLKDYGSRVRNTSKKTLEGSSNTPSRRFPCSTPIEVSKLFTSFSGEVPLFFDPATKQVSPRLSSARDRTQDRCLPEGDLATDPEGPGCAGPVRRASRFRVDHQTISKNE